MANDLRRTIVDEYLKLAEPIFASFIYNDIDGVHVSAKGVEIDLNKRLFDAVFGGAPDLLSWRMSDTSSFEYHAIEIPFENYPGKLCIKSNDLYKSAEAADENA